jgi:hypothetical protein
MDTLELYYKLVDFYKYDLNPRRLIFSGKIYNRLFRLINALLIIVFILVMMNDLYFEIINSLITSMIFLFFIILYFLFINAYANNKAKAKLKINKRKSWFNYWYDYEFELFQLRSLKDKLIELKAYNDKAILDIIEIGLEKYKPIKFETLINKAIVGALILPIWIEFIKWLYENIDLDAGKVIGLTFILILLIIITSFVFKMVYELLKHSFTDMNSVELTIMLNKLLKTRETSE